METPMQKPLAALVALVLALGIVPAQPSAAFAESTPPSTTRLVSATNAGEVGNSVSGGGSVSSDGRWVVFSSYAQNLIPLPVGGRSQIYLRDTVEGTTTLISATRDGSAAGDGNSRVPSISADGSRITYISEATNIVGTRSTAAQVLLWVRGVPGAALISATPDAVPVGSNGEASDAVLSADGGTVVFTSIATDLTALNSRGKEQVYAHTLATGQTRMVSVTKEATPAGSPAGSSDPAVSSDGSVIAFVSKSDLAVEPVKGIPNVYVSKPGLALSLESVPTGAGGAARRGATEPSLSGDGSLLAFTSASQSLISGQTISSDQVWLRDLRVQVTHLVSTDPSGAPGDFTSSNPQMVGAWSSRPRRRI
jgi:hypothetical protein